MFEIKKAKLSDAQVLKELGHRTFLDTFAVHNTASDMDLYLSQTFTDEKQAEVLSDPNRIVFIAWEGDEAMAYLQIQKGKTDPAVTLPNPIEVERLYVDRKHHGKGLAQQLMDLALSEGRRLGHQSIWLGVWGENHKALAFYKKYGYETCGTHIFMLGTDAQTDLILQRTL